MPRNLPPLADRFEDKAASLGGLSRRLEANFSIIKNESYSIRLSDLEIGYELLYLKMFILWEEFLEETFYRILCGYANSVGQEPLLPGKSYYSTIASAEVSVLRGRDYKLWHNPAHVVSRSDGYFQSGCRYRTALVASPKLQYFAAIRHRIAHSQKHAKNEFDNAAMMLAGRRYPGSRPGRMLRDRDATLPSNPRWLSVIADELAHISRMIV